ncbi:HlyD family efflux transporter periplasmic adaptor subunit [Kitasatospora sp. NPDC094011]|uniref:HlyD family efflux transporter periplasmic adaptor subunit n=1 Tax=Kitasatospora sp. NPDC094011 TaxID=3364090 RepID=UPI00381580B8
MSAPVSEPDGADTVMRRRRRLLGLVVVTAALAAGGGAGAATFLKSPAQVAAETAPPPADLLTAAVEHRVVSETVIIRGRATTGTTVDVTAPASGGVPGARAVVTKVKVSAGDSIPQAKVLFEVSGRPVFALAGPLPAYRDLSSGTSGPDVTQLQKSLTRAGYATGPDKAGVFGAGTEKAVAALYQALGYQPLRTTEPTAPGVPAPGVPASGPAGTSTRDAKPRTEPSSAPPAPVRQSVTVPMAELVYLPALPAHAQSVAAKVGAAPGDKLMTASVGDLVVESEITEQERGLLRPGQRVEILDEANGNRHDATVEHIADTPTPAQDGQDAQVGPSTYTLRVKPDERLPADLGGKDVRLTVTAASSDGPVLAVPVAALSTGADGRASVGVLGADGTVRRLVVRAAATGSGFVEVVPEAGTALSPGDRVVVGNRPTGAGGRP